MRDVKRIALLGILLLPGLMMACDGDEVTPTSTPTADLTDAERADLLWAAIDGFDTWNQHADWPGIQYQASGSPHGPWVQIWLNDAANGSASSGDFADGSILVKRTYAENDAGMADASVLVMEKIEGYGSTNWFWAVFDADGTPSPVGDVDMCVSCHSGGTDYSRILVDVPGTPPS